MTRLVVNPITCHAHGVCAELLPEIVTVDEWGYPIIEDGGGGGGKDGEVPPELVKTARRAVQSCPALALTLRKAR